MKQQRTYGALLSYASIIINMMIALAFTPFLVSHLGKSEFGLFNIIGSFAAYLVVLDMGLNDSVIRYLISHKKKQNKKAQKNFLANTFLFYIVLGLLIGVLGLFLYMSLDTLFGVKLNTSEISELKIMTLIITFNAMLTVILNPVGAFIVSSQRFVFLNLSNIILRLLTTLILVIFLYFGYKAVMVVTVTAVLNISLLLFKIWYAYKLGMRVYLYKFIPKQILKLLKYSAPIFVVVLTEVIYWKLDNILLANMIGATAVAVYAIGMMFHKYFMSFSTAISKVMMPKIIFDLDSGANALEMEKTLTSISRIQAMVILLILTGIILYGKAFILLWLGTDYINAYYVMLLTLIPYSLELMGNVRNIFLQVNHLYWYRAGVVFGTSILNIAITIYAIDRWGMVGAAIGTSIGVVIGYISVNYILWSKLGINIISYLKNLFRGIFVAVVFVLSFGYLFSCKEINSWSVLSIHILFYSIFYIVAIYYIAMNRDEQQQYNQLKYNILNKIRKVINLNDTKI